MTTLLAVPNFSEGRDQSAIEAIGAAFATPLLDVHSDPDHDRTVFTLAGRPGELAARVAQAAREARARLDLTRHTGLHPRVGVLDVAPIVYLEDSHRGAACAEALVLADLLGSEVGLPVFLYGLLGGGRTRAELRRGGPGALADRVKKGELRPDFGPPDVDLRTGATLVAARPPLLAFNVELAAGASEADAKRIAADIREGGARGLPGVRAIGLWLTHRNCAQVSTNVEDHRQTPLARVVEAIAAQAAIAEAEQVALVPRAAYQGFPAHIPVRNRRVIEDALANT